MKNKLKTLLLVPLIMMQFLVAPVAVLAAGTPGTPGNIIPDCNESINTDGQFTNSSGQLDSCDFGDFLTLIRNVIRFLVYYLTLPAIAIAVAYAGFLLITSGGDTGKRGEAKDVFVKVAYGILFMIGAWFIVEAIYSGLGYGGFLQF